ncbi:MAG: amidohydrolase family protein [Gemmobacter sp.]|jgi:dihydropyrimidinase|nr:amidohydrolase family protein [Gemmobacter sp.]
MFDLVIRGARLGLAEGWSEGDIGVTDGRITAIDHSLHGKVEIDGAGRWLLPGGIDAHCHLDQPDWGGARCHDDHESGGRAAILGGTTAIISFAMAPSGQTMCEGLARSLARAEGRCPVDYGFHAVATPQTGPLAEQVPVLVGAGVSSVKAFMTYEGFAMDDGRLLDLMQTCRAHGATVLVHAENDAILRWMRRRLAERECDHFGPHLLIHAEAAERDAVARMGVLAEVTGARVVIVHVTGRAGLEELARAQARGVAILGETCPQYVVFDGSVLAGPSEQALRALFAPPPRAPGTAEALWQALAGGGLALWSSDHSPCPLEDRFADGAPRHFAHAVAGVPGLETRLPILFSEGLVAGRLSLARYLELSASAAADIYGIGAKGCIAPGQDADLVLWNPETHWQVRGTEEQSKTRYSAFEGMWLTGRPETVILRGHVLMRDGALLSGPPRGCFLHRRPTDPGHFRTPLEETTPWTAS